MRGEVSTDPEENCSSYMLRPKRRRVVSSISDAQPSTAKSTTSIHSKRANNGRSVSSLQYHVDLEASSVHTSEESGCIQFKSRNELVRSFEPIIESFNSADYETLGKLSERVFCKDVSVSYKLVPDAVTDTVSEEFFDVDSYVIPEQPVQLEGTFHNLTGILAVKILWIFLRETHRSGEMEVIDRRICYRQVLPNYLQLFHTPPSPTPQVTTPTVSTRTSKEDTPMSPVSVLEMVVKLSGACITTRALGVLFDDLSRTVGIQSPLSATRDSNTDSTAVGADPMQVDVDELAKLIPDFLAQQHSDQHLSSHFSQEGKESFELSESSQPIHRVVSASTASTDSAENIECGLPGASLGTPRTIHRKYLADIKLAFNEHDLITMFEFDLRAAEDFPNEL